MYLSAKRKNKREAGSVPENVLKARRIALIVSSVVFGLLLAAVIALALLLFMAIAYM
jgi:hypothetical protein